MRTLTVPPRLRAAAAGLLIAPLFAAVEVALATRAPWWKLPWPELGAWAGAVAAAILPFAWGVSRGNRWARRSLAVLAGAWCALTFIAAFRVANPALGFFSLPLALYWIAELAWLRSEMGRSFFDPRMRWYQGAPRAIPGLRCQVAADDGRRADARVSRIDDQGAFLLAGPGEGLFRLRPGEEAEMIFVYRDRRVRCAGAPVRAVEGEGGQMLAAGFLFSPAAMTADARKELGDFVESLRGEGHA
jgi:hypothetical protein